MAEGAAVSLGKELEHKMQSELESSLGQVSWGSETRRA